MTTKEPIPYDEMTDDQRKAIIEAVRARVAGEDRARPWQPHDRAVFDAVDAATREKRRRWVVEERPIESPKPYGGWVRPHPAAADINVIIVEELDA